MPSNGGLPAGLGDPVAQFELLFGSNPHGAVYLDASATILATNPAARAILGLAEGAAEGCDSWDPAWRAIREDGSPFPPEEHPVVEALRTGESVRGVVQGIWNRAEGRHRWFLLDAVPQAGPGGGAPVGALVWLTDATESVAARTSAASSRGRFASLFANMSEGVALHEVVFGPDGAYVDYRIVDVNPSYPRHVGISRETALGKLGSELYGVSPAPYLEEFCGSAVRGEAFHFETYFPPLDKHFAISVAPLGRTGFATIFFDVSEEKRGLAERERLFAELERKNRELESIVYVASHDLRSPLVNIQGFGERLGKDCEELARLAAGGGPAASARMAEIAGGSMPSSLDYIRASAAKMDRLIAGLLRLSRSGRAGLALAPLDMEHLVRGIMAAMAYQVESAGARLEVGELPPCVGDADQVGQVFANLLDNAVKYRDPARPLCVRVSGGRKGSQVEYRVADNGRGIPPALFEKVWELFYRLDPADGADGDGLGLTLVRRIVERHGGKSWIEQEPGGGCVFVLLLPGGGEA